ncbi:MAG: hypothetical protein M1823_002115 [Watsoniomyces obsoletus]|nr:MAG: hypothetical protein M1823_002115 [Watsoniomyces obsoletus]
MEADWDEVARTAFPPPGLHALHTPVTALAFDNNQELLWTGNEYGRVRSFYGPELHKYTSFRAHPAAEGPVRQLLMHEKGVLSIASKGLHMSTRRGLPIWHITHENMKDLRCMSYMAKGNTEILVAGLQSTMFTVDIEKGVITKEIPAEEGYTMMRRSRYICAATNSGTVHILDSTTLKLVKTWRTHAAGINDMDAQNNFLVTCGYSPRQQQGFMLDPLANAFDLKSLMPLPPIPFHAGAAYVRMHPRMVTTGIVASQTGQLQVVDLMNPNTVNLRQAVVSSYLTNLELAPSGEALALADADCFIQLWGSPSKIRFAEMVSPTEFSAVRSVRTSIEWSSHSQLNAVGMPYYREQLLSAWPSHLVFEIGAPPVKIDPDILASMAPTDFGGYAPNPRKVLRNQAINTRETHKSTGPVMAPKFLSEKARERADAQQPDRRASDVLEALSAMGVGDGLKAEVPVMYRNVEIKYSKFGVDDFDFEFYNRTKFSGLETHIVNSYANPLLQLYRFTPLLRNLALQHTSTSCLSESCLLCELGFLFDMLESASGQNCQATNFLKTFGNLPQAAALGLLEDGPRNTSLSAVIQLMNRFLMERMSSDYKQILPQSPVFDKTTATTGLTSIRCIHCHSETGRPGDTYVTDLVYPSKQPLKGHLRAPQRTFSQVLVGSVERQDQTRGWCGRCRRYQSLATKKTIQSLPDVLLLNAAVHRAEASEFWATPGWLPTEIGLVAEGGMFSCYEGQELQSRLQRTSGVMTVYELVGVVAEIDSGERQASHLVSLINVSLSAREPQTESQWHLFNDFLVKKVQKEEALRFVPSWKLPSILAYQVKRGSNAIDDSWKDNLDTSLLYRDLSINHRPAHPEHRPLYPDSEAPKVGTHVAIDAEFVALQQEEVEIKADGTRETIRPSRLGLARVSVLRGSGVDEGVPFIDDYIATTTEPIVDHLTAFSGIQPGDLDPAMSPHNLVSLKVAYKKLWLLLHLGCVFVGHGLPKDFRIINIHVPKTQVVDTVELFFIKARQRKLSLRFLAWFLLKEDIQTETHDSIEDARTALRLYRKYQEFQDAGVFDRMLNDIYAKGREVNYKAPGVQARRPLSQSQMGHGHGHLRTDLSTGGDAGRDTPPILR